ncbi:unnamed protein product, partial [Phaeothamnion confervicola]
TRAEATVVEIVTARLGARRNDVDAEVHGIRGQLGELPDPRTDGTLDMLPAVIGAEIMKVFQTHGAVIRTTVEAERHGRAEYNAFRQKHGLLERSAHYPVSKVKHFAIVGLLLLVEAAANTVMYLPATSAGYGGAFATALLVAATNIALAVFAGLAARYVALRDLPPQQPNRQRNMRAWAIPALIVVAGLILFINCYAAHYRQVAVSTDTFDEAQVLRHLGAHPFDLSLASFGLLVAGLLFALVAVFK